MTCFAKAYLLAFCELYCKGEGYRSGKYQAPNCLCFDLYDLEAIKSPVLARIKKVDEPKEESDDSWKH